METNYEEIGINNLETNRKNISKLGFAYLWGMLGIIVFQFLTMALINILKPEWIHNTTIYLLLIMLPMYMITMPLMIYIIRRIPTEKVESKHKMTVGQMIIAFLMCYAIMYISNLVGVMITTGIGVLKGSHVSNPIVPLATEGNPLITFFIMVICAPIFEEIIFRKLLIDRSAKYGEGMAVLLSGLMFGLFHGNLSQFMYAFTLGIFFAFIYIKTGRILYSIILHMAINFMGSVLSVIIMNASGYLEYMQEVLNGEDAVAAMQSFMPGIMIYFAYTIGIIGIVAVGIILLIVKHKKFRLSKRDTALPKGKRFSTIFLNPGMGLFVVFWVIYIILFTFWG